MTCPECLGRGWVLDYSAKSPHLAPPLACQACLDRYPGLRPDDLTPMTPEQVAEVRAQRR